MFYIQIYGKFSVTFCIKCEVGVGVLSVSMGGCLVVPTLVVENTIFSPSNCDHNLAKSQLV